MKKIYCDVMSAKWAYLVERHLYVKKIVYNNQRNKNWVIRYRDEVLRNWYLVWHYQNLCYKWRRGNVKTYSITHYLSFCGSPSVPTILLEAAQEIRCLDDCIIKFYYLVCQPKWHILMILYNVSKQVVFILKQRSISLWLVITLHKFSGTLV